MLHGLKENYICAMGTVFTEHTMYISVKELLHLPGTGYNVYMKELSFFYFKLLMFVGKVLLM